MLSIAFPLEKVNAICLCGNFQWVFFLRPNPAWNLCKPLKLMFATLVLPLASVFGLSVTYFLINIHQEE